MILRKSILRQFKEKKFQYFGVIILLLLSIMLYVSMSMGISTLDNRNDQFKEEYMQEDFHMILANEVSSDQLEEWEKNYNLSLEERLYGDIPYNGNGTTLRLFSNTNKINIPYASEGKLPEEADEIALSPVFAKAHHITVGDEIDVKGRTLKVTGLVYLPDYIYVLERESDLLSDPNTFGIGMTTEHTLQSIADKTVTQILGNEASEEERNAFKSAVTENYSLLKWMNQEENPRIQFVESEIESSETMITTLPLFILALSVFMVLMIMKRRLEMQRKEIGTMKALGYRNSELTKHYMMYATIIGLVGSILGVTAGAALSIPITDLYSNYFNLPSISYFDWDPRVLVIGFFVPNIILLIMTYFVIKKPLQQSPLDLLRPKDTSKGKKSLLERLPIINKGSFISRFRIRLLARSKARAVYILLGVMFSSILLIFGATMYKGMDGIVDSTYKDIMTYNYAAHFKTLQQEETTKGESPFTVAEADIIEINGEKAKEIEQQSMIYGIEPDTEHIQLQTEDGKLLHSTLKNGVVLSEPFASALGLSKGDTITLENAYNNKTIEKEVTGIAKVYIGFSIYSERSEVNEFLGYPKGVYTAKWTEDKPDNSEDVLFIENKQDIIENFESTSSLTRYSVFGIAGFAFLIGVIVLTLITNLIVEENSPSISLFKVMGYKDQEISRLMINVYTPIVLLGFLLSVPIGILSIEQLMNSIVEQTGFAMPVQLSWLMILISLMIILFTYYVSLFLSRRKLKNVSLQEALNKQQD
ncbi:ABC transporter permease [Pontibacillus salipaludis]|uniref:ABC transporter permease n=1 Tax=Pontibacillus salipaludis TaxID=1697394 RepID=A0ABQ1QB44_9BACI|nr:FtsX-like permease family protein [Pontibacillus salipaludis]GGD21755.1 ABC transporter permease [Pontibacillus salipaludis]